MKIAYEKHPVSSERKKELRDKGFKILDARFNPDRENGAAVAPPSREDIAEMGREDVIDLLKAHGVDAPKGKVDDLRARLISIMFADL
jgi:hypothetical protein